MWSIKFNDSFFRVSSLCAAALCAVACSNPYEGEKFTAASGGSAAEGGEGPDTGGQAGSGDTLCVPGEQIDCGCGAGEDGTQICNEDGMSYGDCQCEDTTPSDACVPGEQRNCSGENDCQGVQVCNDDRCWGDCVCSEPPPPPTGGAGGQGGTGGSSGTGCSSGTGGSTGGTGGETPTGGAGGQGGTGGTGGSDECLCIPGQGYTCGCPGGLIGSQVCQADCRSLTECDCPAPPTGGTGGMGGTGGSGATGGSTGGMGGETPTGGTGGGSNVITKVFSYQLPPEITPEDLSRVFIMGHALWYDETDSTWKAVVGHFWRHYCDSELGELAVSGQTYSCSIDLPAEGQVFDFNWELQMSDTSPFPSNMSSQWACYVPTGEDFTAYGVAYVDGMVVQDAVSNGAQGCNLTIEY